MATYKINTENEIAGVGQGGTISDNALVGWDIDNLIKTGVLEEVAPSSATKVKE